MLVYVAVFATGWIVQLPTRGQIAAATALFVVLLVNTVMLNFVGGERTLRLSLPGASESPIRERELTLVSNSGYIEGKPDPDGLAPALTDLLERARADGAEQAVFDSDSLNRDGYNHFALSIFARNAGLHVPGVDRQALEPNDIYVFRADPAQTGQAPCLESWDGTGIYMERGQEAGQPVYCPPA
jgi:hypothetical protein